MKMRTLEEIRQKNKRSDLLLDGMESVPVELPYEIQNYERAIYENFVKPHVEKMFDKYYNMKE